MNGFLCRLLGISVTVGDNQPVDAAAGVIGLRQTDSVCHCGCAAAAVIGKCEMPRARDAEVVLGLLNGYRLLLCKRRR